ncbi:MAG: starch-binding protein [Clostridiales bacterium]|nr:starch-binding protein [Clostridiales bacterium]
MKKVFVFALVLCMLFICAFALTTALAEEEDMIVIYARVPVDWKEPHLYAWGAEGAVFEMWPGGAMQLQGNWYTIEIPSRVSSVIINANSGSVQTMDIIRFEQGKDLWVHVPGTLASDTHYFAEFYYEEPDMPAVDTVIDAPPATDAPKPTAAPVVKDEPVKNNNTPWIYIGVGAALLVVAVVVAIKRKAEEV